MGEKEKLFLRTKCKLINMGGMLELESCHLATVSNHLFRQETTMDAKCSGQKFDEEEDISIGLKMLIHGLPWWRSG